MESVPMPKIEELLMGIKIGGLNFTIRCDCKSLTSIFKPKKGIPIMTTGCLQRYAILLSEYDFKIEYVACI